MNGLPEKWRGKEAIVPQEIAEIARLKAVNRKNGFTRDELVSELRRKYFDLNDRDQRQINGISWGIIAANGKIETNWPNEGVKKKRLIITYDKDGKVIESLNKKRIARIEFDAENNDVDKQIIEWN